jgi:hypothetical protein
MRRQLILMNTVSEVKRADRGAKELTASQI